ncbi:MAG TPA: undecaprenyl-diphosphate phosphatase [Thermoleophilaceae bacterium]|nr:undecaprenyl-diphosphate phosphatase [Thermoleophilaceae bacterium]
MSTFESIVLGVVQGLTEFLPISSTAHLRIVPAFVGWEDPGAAYTAVTQLGTMAAVVLFFREDLWRIGTAWLGSLRTLRSDRRARLGLDARLGWYILFATIPIGIFGLAFKDQIETGARNLYLIGIAMIVVGFVLLAAEEVSKRNREIEDIEARDAVGVGLAQTLALVPGVSRSGSTIAAGLFLGLDRPAAARFSFLLSVPAVVLSGLFELLGIIAGSEKQDVATSKLVISTLCAFVVGYAAIAWLLRFLASHSTIVFVVYRVALGSLVLVLVATGAIH